MFLRLLAIPCMLLSISIANNFHSEDKSLKIAEPGLVAYAASYSDFPSDEPLYSTQFDKTFKWMNLGSAHEQYRGDSVKIGIIDSGINYDHEDFKVNGVRKTNGNSKYYSYESSGWVYYGASQHGYSYINDTLGHGTNVAATVAAAVNGIGGVGIAPNVEIYVYKVTNANNGYEFGATQLALNDAKSMGIKVINMSFQSYEHDVTYGGYTQKASENCSTILSDWINSAYNYGITLVGAAGNFNTSEPSYPGSNAHVINVGSLAANSNSEKAPFSNYGSTIDLVAPGYVHVAGIGSTSYYKDTSGTSFSAPIVTGAIALYKQQNPSATPAQIEAALYASCDPIDDSGSPYTNWAGHGALNVEKFLGIDSSVSVTGVSINNTSPSVDVGGSINFTATVSPSDATDKSIYWTVDDSSIGEIDYSTGVFTAKKAGTTTVRVYTNDGGYSDNISVTVTNPVIPVTGVSLDKDELSLTEGDSATLVATISPNNATDTAVTWTSSDDEVASVNNSGEIQALKAGSTTITVTTHDGSYHDECLVTVSEFSGATDEITRALTGVTSGSSSYSTWNNKSVSTSNAVYAGCSAGGNDSIQIRSSGSDSGIVTTTSGGYIRNIKIDFQSSTSNGRTINIYGKNTAYTAASQLFSSSTSGDLLGTIVKGTSTSLSISGDYRFFGLRSASSAIYISKVTVTWGGSSSGGVDPDPTITTFEINHTSLSLDVYNNKTSTLSVTVAGENNPDLTVAWTNSNSTVVSFNTETGLVTALKEGSATITATSNQDSTKTATCVISVSDSTPTPEPSEEGEYSKASINCTETSQTIYTDSVTSSQKITVNFAKGDGSSSPVYNTNPAPHIRAYAKNKITITSSKANVKSISFTFASGEGSNSITPNVGTYSNGVWSGDLTNSVVFTIGGTSGHRRVASIEVSYYGINNFASDFLSLMENNCDQSGENALSKDVWSSGSTLHSKLFDADVKTFKDVTTGIKTGTTLQKAVYYYDLVINKYDSTDYPNFASRSLNKGGFSNLIFTQQSNSIQIIIVIAVLGLTITGVVLYKYKKKHEEL